MVVYTYMANETPRRGRPPVGRVIVTLESEEVVYPYGEIGLTFESDDSEVLEAVQPSILEKTGVNILEDNEQLFTVRKVASSNNTYVFAKSPAGH